ncbi:MAG: helicase-related protein [Gemmatimonadales bacterium]
MTRVEVDSCPLGRVVAPNRACVVPANEVRRAIALGLDERRSHIEETLGDIRLRPHQRVAAERLASLIATHGGAMLAEPVGVGKTFTALAVAARAGQPIVIAAPAALRGMWTDALARCRITAAIVTHEALSRGLRLPDEPRFLVVDEAHRARSPGTRRYAALAELCRRARVLLVSATPVQNAQADLAAEIALYLGRSAWSLDMSELGLHVVRGSADGLRGLPELRGPHRLTLTTADDCLEELLALPPPIPARNESVVAALLVYGLVHQWTSSRAALIAALVRRRARGLALSSAVDAGRVPTRAELGAWTHDAAAVQLAFPELVSSAVRDDDDVDPKALLVALDRHDVAIRTFIDGLRRAPDPDLERAALLRRIRAEHPGERIIAFCHYAETVAVLRRHLAREPGVAALAATGARIASGRVSRDAVIAQFTPRQDGLRSAACARSIDRIDLLITTDLLSEGLNLQEASVVVHLDYPWNPARLDQRVGRVRRLGSRHDAITVYAVAPPADGERVIGIERRLRDKLCIARRAIGLAGRILPSVLSADDTPPGGPDSSLPESTSNIARIVSRWRDIRGSNLPAGGDTTLVAGAEAPRLGFIALVRDTSGTRLIGDAGAGIDAKVATVECLVGAADGPDTTVDPPRAAAALAALDRWLAAKRGAATIDLRAALVSRSRRAALDRIARSLARAPRHRRAQLAPLADAARAAATASLGEGAERVLDTLVFSQLPDEAWLRTIVTFGELNARPRAEHAPTMASRVIALLLLGRDG